jgi:hypothetical protein
MMKPHKMIGLAVAARSILAVEVGLAGGRCRVLHAAEFPLLDTPAAQEPAALGKELRHFLRQNHFSAARCVIGLGARWLVAKEKALPPTAPDLLPGVLRIATERDFATDSGDLAFDFSGPISTPQGQSVLLVAAPRRNVTHLAAVAEAAGLKTAAITSSTMALAAATNSRVSTRRLVLHLTADGAELCLHSNGGLRLLRRLSAAPTTETAAERLDDLVGELQRVIALLPGSETAGTAPELFVWNAAGLPASALEGLRDRLPLAVRIGAFPKDLDVDEVPAALPAGAVAAAVALGLVGLGRPAMPADFLHSRLQPRKKLALKNKLKWGGFAAAAVFLVALAFFLDWQSRRQEIDDLESQIALSKTSVKTAKEIVDKVNFARSWYDRRPKFLDGLVDVTTAFPLEGRIWATSLAVGDDMRVLLSGKATDQAAVMDVVDRLNKSPKFSNVKTLYVREVGGGVSDVSFAISLNFVKAEGS